MSASARACWSVFRKCNLVFDVAKVGHEIDEKVNAQDPETSKEKKI